MTIPTMRRQRSDTLLGAMLLTLLLGIAAKPQARGQIVISPTHAMSLAQLTANVAKGWPVKDRVVKAGDLVKVIRLYGSSDGDCPRRAALRLSHVKVAGSIQLAPTDERQASDNELEEYVANPSQLRIALPFIVTDSTLEGVDIRRVVLGCQADLGGSTIAGEFHLRNVTFRQAFSMEGTVFRKGIEIVSGVWAGPANFSRAQFQGNAEIYGAVNQSGSRFEQSVDFEDTVFLRFANFSGTRFMGPTSFTHARFQEEAMFSGAVLRHGPPKSLSGPFYETEFNGRADFRSTEFQQVTFFKTVFRRGVEFDRASGSGILLMRPSITGQADFSDASLHRLALHGPMIVDGETSLRRVKLNSLDLQHVAFLKPVDLEEAQITDALNLRTVSLGEVHMDDVIVPGKQAACTEENDRKFVISDATISGSLSTGEGELLCSPPLWAFWREPSPRFATQAIDEEELLDEFGRDKAEEAHRLEEKRLWRQLERSFRLGGNLALENDAAYRLARLEQQEKTGFSWIVQAFSWIFWGYGLRPFRVLAWMIILIGGYAIVYATQIRGSDEAGNGLEVVKHKAVEALRFSARTAWEWNYGYTNSRTMGFKILTLSESVAAKAILTCFAYALSQTSPLLKELLKSLLP